MSIYYWVDALRLCLAMTPSKLNPLTIRPWTRSLPGSMFRLLVALLPTLRSAMRSQRDPIIENLAIAFALPIASGDRP
jgi:hypothetical protein